MIVKNMDIGYQKCLLGHCCCYWDILDTPTVSIDYLHTLILGPLQEMLLGLAGMLSIMLTN